MSKPIWLDCGNYTVIPTNRQVQDLAAVGISGAIVGTSFGNVAPMQLKAFERNGWPTEEYRFPERLSGGNRKWWVDAETPTATKASIREALSRHNCRGIYTRSGWWNENLPGWDVKAEFPNAELWDARYIGSGLHGEVNKGGERCLIVDALNRGFGVAEAIQQEQAKARPFLRYGGFTEAAITQWHNSIVIYGVNMDLNTVEAAVAPPQEEDEMVVQLVWCPERGQLFEVGSGDPKPITFPKVADELRKVYGPEKVAMSWDALKALGAK